MRFCTNIAVLLILGVVVACDSVKEKKAAYRADADRFCEIHDIGYWEETGKIEELENLGPSERQVALYRAIGNSVKTPEMKAAVKLDRETTALNEYYSYLQREIPKLTDEPFDCPAVKEFYQSQAVTQ